MQLRRIVLTALAAGIVANVFDFLVNGMLLRNYYTSLAFMNPDPSIAWLVIGDFVAALVLVWVFDRVRGSFGAGAGGGATYGLYAGILVNFPLWIFVHILFQGVSYGTAWLFTVLGILWAVVVGATVGAVYDRTAAAPTP